MNSSRYFVPETRGTYTRAGRREDTWPVIRRRDGFHVVGFVNREAAVAWAARLSDEEAQA